MAKLVDLPEEVILVIFEFLPLFNDNDKLDNGFNGTCKYLSHVWKLAYWKHVAIENVTEPDPEVTKSMLYSLTKQAWVCDIHAWVERRRAVETSLLEFKLTHLLSPHFPAENFHYTKRMFWSMAQKSANQVTASNVESFLHTMERICGNIEHIEIFIAKGRRENYGNFIPKIFRQKFPQAYLKLTIIQNTALAGSLMHWADETPPKIAAEMGEVDVDDVHFELERLGQDGREFPGQVRNGIVLSTYRTSQSTVVCGQLASHFNGLKSLTFNYMEVKSLRTPDCVQCLALHQCKFSMDNNDPVRLQTLASTVSITKTPGRYGVDVDEVSVVLEAPRVQSLTMDMIIYSMPLEEFRHVLPEAGSYELHLDNVLVRQSSKFGATYPLFDQRFLNDPFNQECMHVWKEVIANSTSVKQDIPFGCNVLVPAESVAGLKPDEAVSRDNWLNYLYEMFVAKANGKLSQLGLIVPAEWSEFRSLINDTELGPFIGEVIAHQPNLTTIHLYWEYNGRKAGAKPVYRSRILQQDVEMDRDNRNSARLYRYERALLVLDEYKKSYKRAVDRGVVVERRFGYRARLSGADIL